jgi:nicotinamide-nucleotide amidase
LRAVCFVARLANMHWLFVAPRFAHPIPQSQCATLKDLFRGSQETAVDRLSRGAKADVHWCLPFFGLHQRVSTLRIRLHIFHNSPLLALDYKSMTDDELYQLAVAVGEGLQARGWLLATAESCTGGWVSEAVTAVAGSSEWFDRGYVTYSNRAKQETLGVTEATLARYGAVSEPTVAEMAAGALRASGADLAVAVSGIAGPGGATPGKPVGMVCFGWLVKGEAPLTETIHLPGDRQAVRRQAVVIALQGVAKLLSSALKTDPVLGRRLVP